MSLPQIFTFVCLGIWAVCTLYVFAVAAFRPDIAKIGSGRRLSASNPFDIAMLAGIGAWLAMWCFRTMC